MDLAESYLDVPYDERWELLKPTIVNIYLKERVTIPQLAKRMADDFSFKAECVAPCLEAPAHHQPRPVNSPPFPQPHPPLNALFQSLLSLMSSCRTHQYRYQFKKWGIKKRTTTVEKEAVISALGKRKRRQLDIGPSNIQLVQGDWLKPVDKKQLKRYINDSIHTARPLYVRPGL